MHANIIERLQASIEDLNYLLKSGLMSDAQYEEQRLSIECAFMLALAPISKSKRILEVEGV